MLNWHSTYKKNNKQEKRAIFCGSGIHGFSQSMFFPIQPVGRRNRILKEVSAIICCYPQFCRIEQCIGNMIASQTLLDTFKLCTLML